MSAQSPDLLELPNKSQDLPDEDKQIGSLLDELENRGLWFQTAGEA